jgi:D-alanyl-D-alanine carboxypeptidase
MTSGSIQQVAATEPEAAVWIVQIGAAENEEGARGLLLDAQSRIALLTDFRAFVEKFEKNGQTFFRARFAGFGGRDDATQMCAELKKANLSCLAMQS